MITLVDILELQAARIPDAKAIVVRGDSRVLTFSKWKSESIKVARRLNSSIKKEDLVGVLLEPFDYISFSILSLGIMAAGGTAVPFTHPSHLVSVSSVRERIKVVIGKEWLLSSAPEDDQLRTFGEPAELAYVLLTSGATGAPKAVACSHASFFSADQPIFRGEVPNVLHSLPYCSNGGVESMIAALRGALQLVISPAPDAASFWRDMETARPTQILVTPTLAVGLLASAPLSSDVANSVLAVWVGSSFSSPSLLNDLTRLFRNAEVINVYSLTEASGASTASVFDSKRPYCIGRSGSWGEVLVVDGSSEEPLELPPNEVGEVWIRGGRGRRRYLDDPEGSEQVFLKNGWVRTGDLGYQDDDGFLILVGRNKDLIITGGRNVSPLPIEAALSEHETVLEAFAFGLPHPTLGEFVAAAVILGDTTQDKDSLCQTILSSVRTQLPPESTPRVLVPLDDIPVTGGHKVDRQAVKMEVLNRWSQRERRSPSLPLQDVVELAWRRALGHSDFGIDDDFVSVGGDSLSAIVMLSALRDSSDSELSIERLSNSGTVRHLAQILCDAARGKDGSAEV